MPDMLSKKESVIYKFNFEKKNGNDPNVAIANHDKAVNKKACCVLIDFKWSMFDRKNNIPKVIVIMLEMMKVESNSPEINWNATGTILATPKIINKIPTVKNTVL